MVHGYRPGAGQSARRDAREAALCRCRRVLKPADRIGGRRCCHRGSGAGKQCRRSGQDRDHPSMPAHDLPYFEPAGGQNAEASSVVKAFSLGPIAGDSLAGGMPLRAGHHRRVVTRHPGRRPDASLPGPAPPASAAGGRSPGSPAPGPPGVGMVRAAVTCPSPPWPGRAVAPAPAARCAGPAAARSRSGGNGPSGLGPVRLRLMSDRAVTGAGLSGTRFPPLPRGPGSDGPPRAPPELSPWPSGVARWAVSSPLRVAVSPHRPSEPGPDFFESYRSSWSPVTESNRRPSPYHRVPIDLLTRDFRERPDQRLCFSSVGTGSGRFAPDAISQIPPNRSRRRSPCPAGFTRSDLSSIRRRRATRVRRRGPRPAQRRRLPTGRR